MLEERPSGDQQELVTPQEQPAQGEAQTAIPDPFAEMFANDQDVFGFREPEETEEVPDTQNSTEDQPAPQEDPTAGMSEAEKKSYRYWQAQADKRQNRIDELEAKLNSMRDSGEQQTMNVNEPVRLPPRNPDNGQFVATDSREQALPEKFPDPPPRPEKPRGFSRADAYADDSSDSARYLDEMDKWRNDMIEYGEYRSRYESAKREEQIKKQQAEARKKAAMESQRRETIQKLNSVVTHLKNGYNASDEQVADFMKTMSNRSSLSVDNMWKLYALNRGIPINGVQGQPAPQRQKVTQPSQEFMQQSMAQQVPNPMGVLPANSTHSAKSEADLMMDKILEVDQSQNIF